MWAEEHQGGGRGGGETTAGLGMRKDKGCQEMSGDWLEQLEGRFSPGKLEEAGEESVQGPAGIEH